MNKYYENVAKDSNIDLEAISSLSTKPVRPTGHWKPRVATALLLSSALGLAVAAGNSTQTAANGQAPADTPANSTDSQIQEKPAIVAAVDVKPGKVLSEDEYKALALAAREVVQHAILARQALEDADTSTDNSVQSARSEITQGLKLLAIIQASQPEYLVTTRIDSADKHYQQKRHVKPHYVTMMDEATVEENIIEFSKQSSNDSEKSKANGKDKDDAGIATKPAALDWFSLRHETVKLNPVLSKQLLLLAQKALQEGKTQQALNALGDVEALAVVTLVTEAEVPLMDSLNGLNTASRQIGNGLYDKAIDSLKQASASLKRFEQQGRSKLGTQVKELRGDIDQLLSETEQKVKGIDPHAKLDAAKQEVTQWWKQLRGWIDSGKGGS